MTIPQLRMSPAAGSLDRMLVDPNGRRDDNNSLDSSTAVEILS